MISSTQFKLFLELEPQLREVLQCFYDSRYLLCFHRFVTLPLVQSILTLFQGMAIASNCWRIWRTTSCLTSTWPLTSRHFSPWSGFEKLYFDQRFWKWDMFRNRGLVQYFSPYISADLSKMALSFNTTIPNLVRNGLAILLSTLYVLPRKMSWWSWFWTDPFRPELTLTIGFFLHRCENLEINLISFGFDW